MTTITLNKGGTAETQVELDRKEGKLQLLTEDDMKLRAIKDMLIAIAQR